MIISKLKAKCKEASEELKVLELREAEIDHKQQILRDLKQTIERNVTRKSTRKKPHSFGPKTLKYSLTKFQLRLNLKLQ